MIDEVAECVFCRVLAADPTSRSAVDTVMVTNDHVAVVPALGALEEGHALALTRTHYTSFAEAPAAASDEVDELVRRVRERGPVLVSEHGSYGGTGGGACVEHAHVSILPVPGETRIDLPLPRLGRSDSFRGAVQSLDRPYLAISEGDGFAMYDARRAPSQLVRRAYRERQGRDDWDWALFPEHQLVASTLRMWSDL